MLKAIDKWLFPYFRSELRKPRADTGPTDLFLAVCDHFEPLSPGGTQPENVGDRRVARWLKEWPRVAGALKDADGRHPCHSIFYPAEAPEGADRYVPMLLPLLENGWAEMEIHLHHRNDTAANLRKELIRFRDHLHAHHGILGKDHTGAARYGFIHGNWALCNSRSDGDWCGVNNEIEILLETGCYADFTFPSIPSPTQPRHFCNDIYWCRDLKGRPRSHDAGRRTKQGSPPEADELLMIQGPVGLNWRSRKAGLIPRIENADLSGGNPPGFDRAKLWANRCIHVAGRPNWRFIKLHTHGCIEKNCHELLGGNFAATLRYMLQHLNDGKRFRLHFVSARELANLAKAAVSGAEGEPRDLFDFAVKPPEIRKGASENRLEACPT